MTVDFKSVSIRGVRNFPRARVLWKGGELQAFDATGIVLDIQASEPKRMKGHLRTWVSKTDFGELVLRGKCMTCGGRQWWRVLRAPAEELWHV